MADIDLELDALEEARAVVAGEAGRVVSSLTRAVVADLEAAGRCPSEAERVLDATIRRVQQTDGAGAAVLASAGG